MQVLSSIQRLMTHPFIVTEVASALCIRITFDVVVAVRTSGGVIELIRTLSDCAEGRSEAAVDVVVAGAVDGLAPAVQVVVVLHNGTALLSACWTTPAINAKQISSRNLRVIK